MTSQRPRIAIDALLMVMALALYTGAFWFLDDGFTTNPDPQSAVPGFLLLGLRALMWPGLLLSRLGLALWTIVPILLISSLSLLRSLQRHTPKWSWLPKLVAPLYLAVALVYCFWLPVPRPARALPNVADSPPESAEDFEIGFDAGYRGGMLNLWSRPNGVASEALGRGLWTGYLQGLGEWRRLVPHRSDSPSVMPKS